jgi:pyruvate dehydrogenase E1 component
VGDAMARGFLLGATAGRTTLNGEGLQHEDGHSHILASTVPSCVAYDVAYAYELAAIIENGLERMFEKQENVYYYITLQNESYAMPAMPPEAKPAILRGIYKLKPAEARFRNHVQLFGSGSILNEVLRAQKLLAERYNVSADVWGVTSYQQLRRDALASERHSRFHPREEPRVPHIVQALEGVKGPFIAATDYLKLVPDQIARWVPGRFVPLGTDGFGMSDTREALRRHFEVDAENICVAALDALQLEGRIDPEIVATAIDALGLDPEKIDALDV